MQSSVYAVAVGDDVVFLDVGRDRYLCWPSVAGLRVCASGDALEIQDASLLGDLRAAGLVRRGPPDAPRAPTVSIAPPACDLARDPGAQRHDLQAMARAAFDAAVTYQRNDFAQLVAFGRRHEGPSPDVAPPPKMRAMVRGFQTWAPWLPAPAKCLIRSFTLLRLLRRGGFDARWVFAVRTWPFEAHCWLQAGDVVLDDELERLVAFHPILVV
ncbi:MAG TPA: lasso peptide biosynthesis B2 protein [Phenylobacterium sp.]|nr:lasso peptide biosynthesis B2 protein [Phenylobacterium sp.]